jgi:hypothetical protein
MATMALVTQPKPRRKDAEQRIRQLCRERNALLDQNDELRKQVAFLQRVATQMLSLLPKPVVARILQPNSSQPTEGETYVSSQKQYGHHQNKPSPTQGADAAGRQGALCRSAQAGA